MAKMQKVQGADGFYRVFNEWGDLLGEVRKVYTGRSSTMWIIDPVAYDKRVTTRVGYWTRKDALRAIEQYDLTGRRSLVEG